MLSSSCVGCATNLRLLTSLETLDECPMFAEFRVHGLSKMGDHAALDMTACAAFIKESRMRFANAPTPQEIRGEAPPFSFPLSRWRPVVKALEKCRLQPMYAKLREHGAPVQGARLGGKPEKQRTK